MDGNAMPASNQKKAIALDDELVELLWQNGSVTAQAQTHQRHSGRCQSLHRTSASGLTGEETAPWFPGALDHGGNHGVTLEKDLYSQLWQNIANGIGSAAMDGDILIGPGPQPTDFAHFARAPPMSGIGSSWTGEVGSSFCGSNQVPRIPVDHGENTALPSDGLHGVSTHDGTGTSSSGGSGSNFGGSGLPSMSTHGNKRKGKGRDDPHSRGEDVEYEAIEEAKSLRRSASKRRSRAAEVHNLSERRRRDRINEKMRALQELIPHCNKTDKASILDEAIEYLKSLQMQVQIMWMSTRTAPIMFPGTHQFISPMAIGVNSACMPAMQVLSQLQRVPPYMNQPLPNQLPHNSFPTVSANVANQMQNVRIGESTNPFIHLGGAQTAAPQVPSSYAYRPQVAQENEIPEVPVSTILTTSGTGPPSS